MGRVLMTGGGGGGGSSDDCTATANDILKGKTAVYNGSGDEPQEGTLELTGDAADGYVYSGKTYYNTDARTKRTGTMTVGSILNFSAAAYSGRQVLLKWQNPYAATGKPFGGVFINYSTSGYPGTGGTRIYTGYGNNSATGGWSQVIVTLPNLNTTYYFSCTAYVGCSVGDMWGNTMNASCKTSGEIWQNITWSQNYTIPAGYNYVDIFCVGGGGGGSCAMTTYIAGGGGAGGYTNTAWNVAVSGGQVLNCSVGAGGAGGVCPRAFSYTAAGNGGASSVSRSGSTLCSASGGNGAGSGSRDGGSGGSGGGGGSSYGTLYAGGSNGGNGQGGASTDQYIGHGGSGQGRTTKAWGNGTLYSGGGGGGSEGMTTGGSGGSGGGGAGGGYTYVSGKGPTLNATITSGSTNTGGGGGGGGAYHGHGQAGNDSKGGNGAAGGSGIILLHIH